VALVAIEAPEGTSGNEVRSLAQEIRTRLGAKPAVVAVASRSGGKGSLVVAANAGAKDRGLGAGDLVKGALSGRGGGNADLAQGGGVPADQVPALLAAIENLVSAAAR
jgi:alanyl-tRNA synthetase